MTEENHYFRHIILKSIVRVSARSHETGAHTKSCEQNGPRSQLLGPRVSVSGRVSALAYPLFISRSVSRPLIFYNGYKKENKYQKEEKVVNNISKKIGIFCKKIIKKVRRIKEI